MNTGQLLEQMTDSGKFEILATAAFCIDNPEYRLVVHLGINSNEETIRALTDGFAKVPGTNRYLYVQHTITDRKNLASKWLADPKEDSTTEEGDLLKVVRLADTIRAQNENAEFVVILTSNVRLDQKLMGKVYDYASSKKIEVVFYEQSRLKRILDTTKEGHWLRKKYLGVEAELLSRSLLAEISKKSLDGYRREFDFTEAEVICRSVKTSVSDSLKQGHELLFLIGDSGKGKTTLCRQILSEHIESGGFGIWVPEHILDSAVSIESAIETILLQLNPSIMRNCFSAITSLLQSDERFVLVVDDVSRLSSPSKAIDRLAGWLTVGDKGGNPIFGLCPLKQHCLFGSQAFASKKNRPYSVSIDFYSKDETKDALTSIGAKAGRNLQSSDIDFLSKRLNFDPILVGLFGAMLSNTLNEPLQKLAENVVQHYIKNRCELLSGHSNPRFLVDDFLESLEKLAFKMLESRQLNPSLGMLREWFKNDQTALKSLNELIFKSEIIYHSPVIDRLDFRHDVLADHFLATAAVSSLLTHNVQVPEFLSDPYFSPVVGLALSRVADDFNFSPLVKINPVALVETLRHIPGKGAKAKRIVDELNQFLQKSELHPSVLSHMSIAVSNIDSQAIHGFIKHLPKYPSTYLSQLRNGDINGAFGYCAMYGDFAPRINDKRRDDAFRFAIEKYHLSMLNSLKAGLTQFDDIRSIKVILQLAGFFGFPETADLIIPCWEKASDAHHTLPDAIWACARTPCNDFDKTLGKVLEQWNALPDESVEGRRSLKGEVSEELRFAFKNELPTAALDYMCNWAHQHPDIERCLAYALERVDYPRALEFVVSVAGKIMQSLEGTDKISFWLLSFGDCWIEGRAGGRRMSRVSRKSLTSIWESDQDDFMKKAAFDIWCKISTPEDLETLKTIPKTSPYSFQALYRRVYFSDLSALDDYIERVEKYPHWIPNLSKVWCQKAFNYIVGVLDSSATEDLIDDIVDLLRDIPTSDAESLLLKYWHKLKDRPPFIQMALFVGTPALVEKADVAIGKTDGALLHVCSRFGFKINGRQEKIRPDHVKRLLKYLDKLSGMDIYLLAEYCSEIGDRKTLETHLIPKLPNEFKWHYPSDADLLHTLDKIVTEDDSFGSRYRCLESIEKRLDAHSPFSILGNWLDSRDDIKAFRVAAGMIAEKGMRRDLDILRSRTERFKKEAQAILQNATYAVKARTLD